VKYTTVVVRVMPDFAPVCVSSKAGNGVTVDNRPPVNRINVGSIFGPTLRTAATPSLVLAMRVTTRCPTELPGATAGSDVVAESGDISATVQRLRLQSARTILTATRLNDG
jgi:hypothetical protein